MKNRQQVLQRQIRSIKQELATLADLRPGALSQQYNICGNPNCRCKATPPLKHGPYYQVSFTRRGKSSSQFVRAEDVAEVRQQLANHRRLRELVEEWIDLAAELSTLRLREKHAANGGTPQRKLRRGPHTTRGHGDS
jgi:hypothetical protein